MYDHFHYYDYTCIYLEKLNVISQIGWRKHRDVLINLSGEEYVIHKLSLLNPSMYEYIDISKSKQFDKIQECVQGPRSFKKTPMKRKCESKDLWGYDCPFNSNFFAFDHDFPYSLGGPTNEAFNKRILCKWHNMVKSNDIHNFDWKGLFEEYFYYQSQKRIHWIDEQLNKLAFEFNQ